MDFKVEADQMSITVEAFLRQQVDLHIQKVYEHSQFRIKTFAQEAERVKKELNDILGPTTE